MQQPSVTCIMPTRGRPAFVEQSIRYFRRQTYPNRELVIVDDADTPPLTIPDLAQDVRYVKLPGRRTIGEKRNYACRVARGSIIAHWDDDDWYGAERLAKQVAPLLAGDADVSALTAGVFFVLPSWEFFRCTAELHRRLFVRDVHGGTLVYQRALWANGAQFPPSSIAEDALFLENAVRNGARLARLPGDDVFVYLRHTANSWKLDCGVERGEPGWFRVEEPALLAEDRDFYRCHGAFDPSTPARPARPDGRHVVRAQPGFRRISTSTWSRDPTGSDARHLPRRSVAHDPAPRGTAAIGRSAVEPGPRPRLSIIITCHRFARRLAVTLRNWCHQNAPIDSFEILVVNPESPDGLRERLARVARRHAFVRLKEVRVDRGHALNKGRMINRGVAAARGEWIWLTDADCLFSPSAVQTVLDAIRDDTAGLLYCRRQHLSEAQTAGLLSGKIDGITGFDGLTQASIDHAADDYPYGYTQIVPRALLESAPYGEHVNNFTTTDMLFIARCSDRGIPWRRVDGLHCLHLHHPFSWYGTTQFL